MLSIALSLISFIFCFVVSHFFFRRYLLKETLSPLSDFFSAIFGFSNILLLMIIAEITDLDDYESRNLFFKVILYSYTFFVYYAFPLVFFYSMILSMKSVFVRVILVTIFFYSYLAASFFIYRLFKSTESMLEFLVNPYSLLEYVGIISNIVSAFLSAFGSVQMTLNLLYFPIFKANHYKRRYDDKTERLKSLNDQIKYNNLELGCSETQHRITTEIEFFKSELEVDLQMLIEKNKYNDLMFNDIYSMHQTEKRSFRLQLTFLKYAARLLAIYSFYRILNTLRNLLMSDYNNVNLMLRQEMLSIVDGVVYFIAILFRTHFSEIYYTVIEQYFSLIVVGIVIVTNLRSFLILLQFIYLKTSKAFSKVNISKGIQMIFLSYLCCLFYVTSSLFLISNLPMKHRNDVSRLFGDIDFSSLKLLYDLVYFCLSIFFFIVEFIIYLME